MTITLSLTPFTLSLGHPELTPWQSGQAIRERIDPPSLSYSAYGSPLEEGTAYEPRFMWDLKVRLMEADLTTLESIHALWLATRPILQLDDLTRPLREPAPRTRALAPAASETTVNGVVSYYARFSAFFTSDLRIEAPEGLYFPVAFRLKELEKTTP